MRHLKTALLFFFVCFALAGKKNTVGGSMDEWMGQRMGIATDGCMDRKEE